MRILLCITLISFLLNAMDQAQQEALSDFKKLMETITPPKSQTIRV